MNPTTASPGLDKSSGLERIYVTLPRWQVMALQHKRPADDFTNVLHWLRYSIDGFIRIIWLGLLRPSKEYVTHPIAGDSLSEPVKVELLLSESQKASLIKMSNDYKFTRSDLVRMAVTFELNEELLEQEVKKYSKNKKGQTKLK